ncbi:MAG: uL30 family ribosomal protein [Nanoarchaeota archaeon]
MPTNNKICAIRVRGQTGVKTDVVDTLNMLRLYKNNYCVVLEPKKEFLGMLSKCKDYITWGEIDKETHEAIVKSRGEEYKGRLADSKGKINYKKFIVINDKKYKPFFRLNPPIKGFGRNGIKATIKQHGALGYRGDKMKELVLRMI